MLLLALALKMSLRLAWLSALAGSLVLERSALIFRAPLLIHQVFGLLGNPLACGILLEEAATAIADTVGRRLTPERDGAGRPLSRLRGGRDDTDAPAR